MSKEYLTTLMVNFALFHKQIQSTDIKGLLEWIDSLSFDELLKEFLGNARYIDDKEYINYLNN